MGSFVRKRWRRTDQATAPLDSGVIDGTYVAQPPPGVSGGRWFSSTSSPWNLVATDRTTVGDGAASLASNSASLVSQLYSSASGININMGPSFTPAVFDVSRWTTVNRIWKHSDHTWTHDSVPTPTSWTYVGTGERHFFIVDETARRGWGFLNPSQGQTADGYGTHHHASASSTVNLDGSGWWNNQQSIGGYSGPWAERASGASCGGGLVRRVEFQSGVIPHALACCMPFTAVGTRVLPASGTDGGNIPGNNFVPMGTRFRINPSVNIDTLGFLEPQEKILCKAIQNYGMYVVDTSSAFAIYMQNTSEGDDAGTNPFGNISPMSKEIIQYFQVLNPPLSVTYDDRNTFGQPHK